MIDAEFFGGNELSNCKIWWFSVPVKINQKMGYGRFFRFFDIAPSVLRPLFADVVALMVINWLIFPDQLIFQFKAKQFIVEILSFFIRKTNCTRIPSIIYSRDNV